MKLDSSVQTLNSMFALICACEEENEAGSSLQTLIQLSQFERHSCLRVCSMLIFLNGGCIHWDSGQE